MRKSRDEVFLEMTEALSQRSVCKRAKVGAMIVKDGRPISVGYNGPPSGFDHCESCSGAQCTISIHAEMNAIAFAAKEGVSIKGSTLYCSYSPCINCAKIIINSGIERVVYEREYRLRDGIELLEKCIKVESKREEEGESLGKEREVQVVTHNRCSIHSDFDCVRCGRC